MTRCDPETPIEKEAPPVDTRFFLTHFLAETDACECAICHYLGLPLDPDLLYLCEVRVVGYTGDA